MSAQGWLARAGPGAGARLAREGLIFPEPGSLEPCRELAPALVVFAHPPGVVFRLLVQTERHIEFLPGLKALRAVSRGPEFLVDRHELSIFFTRIAYHVEQQWSPDHRRIFWRLSAEHENDIRALEGFWELLPLDGGRTLGLYGTLVDVGPVLPMRMQQALTRKNMREALGALREWVDENGVDENGASADTETASGGLR